jgi:Amidohydrolase family
MKTSKHGAGREAGITRREIIGAAAGIGAASVFNPREAPAADLPGRGEFVIRSADVLTMDPALGDVDGDVHVSNGEIVAVGRDLGAASAEVIDARKMIALPGLIDTHNHIWNSTCRNVVMEGPERGYFRTVATLGKQYTPEDTYRGVRLGCAEMIYSGVTTVNDWSHNIRSPEHARADIRALKDTGIRARFSYGTYQGGPPQDQTMDLADLERSAWHHAASTRRALPPTIQFSSPSRTANGMPRAASNCRSRFTPAARATSSCWSGKDFWDRICSSLTQARGTPPTWLASSSRARMSASRRRPRCATPTRYLNFWSC